MHSSTFSVPLLTFMYLTLTDWLKVGEGEIISNCTGRKIVPHVQNGLPTDTHQRFLPSLTPIPICLQ